MSIPVDTDRLYDRLSEQTVAIECPDRETAQCIIDALLDSPPGREFNKKELGDHAGVSRESIRTYVDTLLKFNVVEEVPDTNPQRYRLNDEGKVTRALFELQSALNAEGTAATQDQRNIAPEGEE